MSLPRTPKVVAFYAYKGGTGRTFALASTAWALARNGRRVVVIDLDLAAPSLWSLYGTQKSKPEAGFVEYLQSYQQRKSPTCLIGQACSTSY